MDHLELPRNPKHPPIYIPLVARENYDGGNLESYPQRMGWSDADVTGSDGCAKSKDERASFIQTWLFFGLLSKIFGNDFKQDDWITHTDVDHPVIKTRNIEDHLKELELKLNFEAGTTSDEDGNVSEPAAIELEQIIFALSIELEVQPYLHAPHCTPAIENVLFQTHNWNLRILRHGPYNSDLDLVCLSIAALGEKLCSHFGILDDDMWLRGSDNNLIFQRMLNDGWCPLEIIRLREVLIVSDLYYISNMDRPGPTRCHQECREHIPLERVDDQTVFPKDSLQSMKCTAYHMDWENYHTQHVEGCDGCGDLVADGQLLENILQGGFLPLLLPAAHAIDRSLGGTPPGKAASSKVRTGDLRIVSSETHRKYVCISHVWSDGLGNPHANAFPTCQYARVSDMLKKLYPGEEIPFWIDTICVPREPRQLRRKAIMLMRKTYWDADSVLVLDSYLVNVDLDMIPRREAWLRFLSCGWNRRLWTLQESAMAKTVYLRFSDGFLDLDKCLTFKLPSRDTLMLLWRALRGAWRRWSEDLPDWEEGRLSTLSDSVAWRSTSILADEAICLGNLTDIEDSVMEQILLLDSHEERMVKFWEAQKKITTEVLFWGGPRLPQFPMRWAPLSFLDGYDTPYMTSQTNAFVPAFLNELGLKFKLPGMILGSWRRNLWTSSLLRTQNKRWYAVTKYNDKVAKVNEENALLAVIFQEPDESFLEGLPVGAAMPGVLVSLSEKNYDVGCIFAKYESMVTIEKASRHGGWIDPLEKMVSRFNDFYRPEMSGSSIEMDGTKLGHYNDDSTTESDIAVHWHDDRLSLDLSERHLMFEVSELSSDQDWCVG
jgi:hypothetical protein